MATTTSRFHEGDTLGIIIHTVLHLEGLRILPLPPATELHPAISSLPQLPEPQRLVQLIPQFSTAVVSRISSIIDMDARHRAQLIATFAPKRTKHSGQQRQLLQRQVLNDLLVLQVPKTRTFRQTKTSLRQLHQVGTHLLPQPLQQEVHHPLGIAFGNLHIRPFLHAANLFLEERPRRHPHSRWSTCSAPQQSSPSCAPACLPSGKKSGTSQHPDLYVLQRSSGP